LSSTFKFQVQYQVADDVKVIHSNSLELQNSYTAPVFNSPMGVIPSEFCKDL